MSLLKLLKRSWILSCRLCQWIKSNLSKCCQPAKKLLMNCKKQWDVRKKLHKLIQLSQSFVLIVTNLRLISLSLSLLLMILKSNIFWKLFSEFDNKGLTKRIWIISIDIFIATQLYFYLPCFVIWCAAENILPRLFKNIWLWNWQKYFKQSFVVQVMHQMCQYSSENNLKFHHWLQFLQNLAASHPAAYHSFDSFLKNPFNSRFSSTMGQCHIFIIFSLVFPCPIIW